MASGSGRSEPLMDPHVARRAIDCAFLGHGKMGRAFSEAARRLPGAYPGSGIEPRLRWLIGRDPERTAAAARRFGYLRHGVDWHEAVADDSVRVFGVLGPNHVHSEPTIAAARAGKHVLCEKPLARDADEALGMLRAVMDSGVHHLCAFNFRFFPAVRFMKECLEQGELGEVVHFRATYLQEWLLDPEFPATWRLNAKDAGSGVIGDLGSHLVDAAHYLLGDIAWVQATSRTLHAERPRFVGTPDDRVTVDVEDSFVGLIGFVTGQAGTIEASRTAHGSKNRASIEVSGTRGSLAFDMERLNEIQLCDDASGGARRGWRRILVTDADHPLGEAGWGRGHGIGWEYPIVHELHEMLFAVAYGRPLGPHAATFLDGYRCAEVCDALRAAASTGDRRQVDYRA